jgi:hypothetical protein
MIMEQRRLSDRGIPTVLTHAVRDDQFCTCFFRGGRDMSNGLQVHVQLQIILCFLERALERGSGGEEKG